MAEFASLMKTLGGYGLTKRQMYHLINMMDANFDRTIRYNEFMEFFLVVWVGVSGELRNNLRLHKKGAPDDGTLDYGHQLTENQIKRKLAKAEHAMLRLVQVLWQQLKLQVLYYQVHSVH